MAVFRLKMYLGRTERKRKALHMLILSGVVRPSHTELRYATRLGQAEEQIPDSPNSIFAPTQTSPHLHRCLSSLQRRITQLIALKPSFLKPSMFKPRRAATSRMGLRSLAKSECESSLVPLP